MYRPAQLAQPIDDVKIGFSAAYLRDQGASPVRHLYTQRTAKSVINVDANLPRLNVIRQAKWPSKTRRQSNNPRILSCVCGERLEAFRVDSRSGRTGTRRQGDQQKTRSYFAEHRTKYSTCSVRTPSREPKCSCPRTSAFHPLRTLGSQLVLEGWWPQPKDHLRRGVEAEQGERQRQ